MSDKRMERRVPRRQDLKISQRWRACVENREKPFTPGWSVSMAYKEGLPIKVGQSVVKTYLTIEEAQNEGEYLEGSNDLECANLENVSSVSFSSIHNRNISFNEMNFGSLYHARLYIGLACSKIVANPGKSLSPRRNCDGLEDREYPRLSDLIDLLNHTSIQVAELAMLSLLLVFKDICPSHRIKLEADEDHLKKVTRRSRYIDKTLLEQYCKFTNFLQLKVDLGLGNTKNTVSRWDAAARLGLSAFRCQCELMKHLYHFNFRSVIMSSVVARGSQPSAKIRNTYLDCVDYIFRSDSRYEVTLEIVKLISVNLASLNYNVDEAYLRILEKVHLGTHIDRAEAIRRQAKISHKKRRREENEVKSFFVESEFTIETSRRRFQLDCLHEMCIIYFRIMKQKVGFHLVSVALTGICRISYLLNVETMEDLVVILKRFLSTGFSTPTLVKLNCVLCGLETLSGASIELHVDVCVFVDAFYSILISLEATFMRWDLVICCIEHAFLKRREIRPNVVPAFVRQLLLATTQIESSISIAVVKTIQFLLIRYPIETNNICGSTLVRFSVDLNEDEKADRAMETAFSENDSVQIYSDDKDCVSALWSLSLLHQHADAGLRSIATDVCSKHHNNSVGFSIANVEFDKIVVKSIDDAFRQICGNKEVQNV